MRDTIQSNQIQTGVDVFDDADQHIGTVAEVGPSYFIVQKGLLFPKDIYVPLSAVSQVTEHQVIINVSKSEVESMGWDEPPTVESERTSGSYADSDEYGTASSRTADRGTERVRVHEEELEARKTQRQAGEVSVRKDVIEEQQSMDVPVTREEVRVRRVPVDRDATADDATFRDEGETLRVPVMEEDVEVTKRPRVVEELEIEKVARQDTKRVGDTVRREQVNVSGQGVQAVDDDLSTR